MTAGQSAAGRDVESINEEAVELLARALSSPVRSWNWDHVSYESDREGWRYEARDVLDQLRPLLRLSDVPGLERQLRDEIAGEIEAKRDADRSWRAFNFAERVNDTALLIAAQIARGSELS